MNRQSSKAGYRKVAIFASIAGILLGGVGSIFLLGILRPKSAGILIETNVDAQVFIDGKRLGKTPLDTTLSPHEAVVRVVPNSQFGAYETKVNLSAGIKTIIRRNFGPTEADTSGEIISFEKVSDTGSVISVVTDPDGGRVFLDGRAAGFAPLKLTKIAAGNHKLTVEYPGSGQRNLSVRTLNGYNLTAVVKLANSTNTSTLGVQTKSSPQVEVLETAAGFLIARETPTTASNEVGHALDGQKYNFISKSSDSQWYEVDLGGGKSGWISVLYATVSGELK
ncbi:MAG TPA: PEGA domain-containing protein [Patescibacteria group bacterium]